jgi:hypothetical protein
LSNFRQEINLPLAVITFLGATSSIGAIQHGNSPMKSFMVFTFGAILLSFNLGAYLEQKKNKKRNFNEQT